MDSCYESDRQVQMTCGNVRYTIMKTKIMLKYFSVFAVGFWVCAAFGHYPNVHMKITENAAASAATSSSGYNGFLNAVSSDFSTAQAVAQMTNISFGERGVYVADTGNNRIQSFSPPAPNSSFSIDPSTIRFAFSTNFNQPAAIAAVDSLTNELFYVADTGNNRVILCNVPTDSSDTILAVWNSMTNRVFNGDMWGSDVIHQSQLSIRWQVGKVILMSNLIR